MWFILGVIHWCAAGVVVMDAIDRPKASIPLYFMLVALWPIFLMTAVLLWLDEQGPMV